MATHEHSRLKKICSPSLLPSLRGDVVFGAWRQTQPLCEYVGGGHMHLASHTERWRPIIAICLLTRHIADVDMTYRGYFVTVVVVQYLYEAEHWTLIDIILTNAGMATNVVELTAKPTLR